MAGLAAAPARVGPKPFAAPTLAGGAAPPIGAASGAAAPRIDLARAGPPQVAPPPSASAPSPPVSASPPPGFPPSSALVFDAAPMEAQLPTRKVRARCVLRLLLQCAGSEMLTGTLLHACRRLMAAAMSRGRMPSARRRPRLPARRRRRREPRRRCRSRLLRRRSCPASRQAARRCLPRPPVRRAAARPLRRRQPRRRTSQLSRTTVTSSDDCAAHCEGRAQERTIYK